MRLNPPQRGVQGLQTDGWFGATVAQHAIQASQEALSMTRLAACHEKLLRRLKKYNLAQAVAVAGGLLTQAENCPCTVRLEALCHLAAATCIGGEPLPPTTVREWLNGPLLDDDLGTVEDPAEDVFVSCIVSWIGTTRIFEGIGQANDFYLQTLLSALNRPAGARILRVVLGQTVALLALSDAVASRSKVGRFASSEGQPRQQIRVTKLLALEVAARVTFSREDLSAMNLAHDNLKAFVFDASSAPKMFHETIGHTTLERYPLVAADDNELILALPTAVSPAIRRFILETATATGQVDNLRRCIEEEHLARLLEATGFGWEIDIEGEPRRDTRCETHELRGTFDRGGYALIALMHDDVADVVADGLSSYHHVSPAISSLIASGMEELGKRSDFRCGLTLIVHGGFGRGFVIAQADPRPGWHIITMSLHDYVLLSREESFSAIRAWKLLRQTNELAASGIEIMNPNGFVNLYAWLAQCNFKAVPNDAGGHLFGIATNFVAGLRERLRLALDRHAVKSWESPRWVEVERRRLASYFPEDERRPMYVVPAELHSNRLLGCVETSGRVFWVGCRDQINDSAARSVAFQVWDMALEWLERGASVLEEQLPALPSVVAFILTFPDLDKWSGRGAFNDNLSFHASVALSGSEVLIGCDLAYLSTFSLAENAGDRGMVEAIVKGACSASNVATGAGFVREIVERIVPDTKARFFHMTPTTFPREMIWAQLRLPPPRLIQPEDSFRSTFRLPELAGYLGEPGSVSPDDVQPLLGKAVDALWERIRRLLMTLDRRALIERALVNHEAIDKDRSTWSRTASAVLAVHRDKRAALSTAVQLESDRSRASLATRVVAEMALCTSPLSGGLPPTTIEQDQVLADVALLIDVASASDALHYGLHTGGVSVRPNKTFDLEAVIGGALKGGYMKASGDRAYLDAAQRYHTYFEEVSGSAAKFDSLFEQACVAEFGATVSSLVDIALMFTEWALRDGQPVLTIRRSMLVSGVSNLLKVPTDEADGIIRRLSLSPRARWDEIHPTGASQRDWYPWRFGRKLSLTRRPLVVLSDEPDTDILVSVGLYDRSLLHLLGALDARLPAEMFDTDEMRSWIGASIDRAGHAFNRQVAKMLSALGLEAKAEIPMQDLGGPKELGDLDVIAWRPGTNVVHLIECKRLSQARTIGEIGERMKEYTDVAASGRHRSPVRKHLDRVAFLKANPEAAGRFFQLRDSPDLRSCIVTEGLVPMQFSPEAAALIDMFVDLDNLSAAFSESL